MGSESHPLHILFFPFMAAGHMIPIVDMAKLFSAHGVKTTILTTPANAAILSPSLLHHPVTLHLIPFPSAAAGLPEGSVVYVCFGSLSDFNEAQMDELALGLEASGQQFLWVVRNGGHLPDGFEERVGDRGLIIKGWAPQTLILEHSATGAFVTHCGWNSVLEGVSAGVPMVTWPLYAEQFFNERLVVDVLRLGVAVGSKVYSLTAAERPLVDAAEVERAVREVMGSGEEAQGRRRKARELGETAKRAVEEGGSSFDDAEKLIKELLEMRGKTVESL